MGTSPSDSDADHIIIIQFHYTEETNQNLRTRDIKELARCFIPEVACWQYDVTQEMYQTGCMNIVFITTTSHLIQRVPGIVDQ
jgi:hypothetical protein